MAGRDCNAAYSLRGLVVANVDGDTPNEFILCRYDHLYVYSGDGILEWDVSGIGGEDIVVGQMDVDFALEIALTDGNVVDSASKTVQWS